MKTNLLEGKIPIITGAGSGIGKAIAKLFAIEGSVVIVNDIDIEKANLASREIHYKTCSTAVPIKADVTNSIEVNKMIKKVVDFYKSIDVLVNNAGILFPTRFEDITENEWDNVIKINLKGTFIFSKAVVPVMKKNR